VISELISALGSNYQIVGHTDHSSERSMNNHVWYMH